MSLGEEIKATMDFVVDQDKFDRAAVACFANMIAGLPVVECKSLPEHKVMWDPLDPGRILVQDLEWFKRQIEELNAERHSS